VQASRQSGTGLRLFTLLIGAALIGFAVLFISLLTSFCDSVEPHTLAIQNETSASITVGASTLGAIAIPAGHAGTLRLGGVGEPGAIYVLGAVYFECSWPDAKRHEPVIVTEQGANCTDITAIPTTR
jgi:hypothetical protein